MWFQFSVENVRLNWACPKSGCSGYKSMAIHVSCPAPLCVICNTLMKISSLDINLPDNLKDKLEPYSICIPPNPIANFLTFEDLIKYINSLEVKPTIKPDSNS